jgi:Spy/CpxP family protein refolding chaperone
MIILSLILFFMEGFDLPEGKWWLNEEVVRNLQITEAQQKELGKIYYSHLEKAIDLKAKVEKEELKLREMLDQKEINEKELLSQVDRLLEARNSLERARAELFVKVRIILTPEQWQKVKERFHQKIKRIREERGLKRPLRQEPVPPEPKMPQE